MNQLPSVLVLGDIVLDIVFSAPFYPAEGAEVVVDSASTRLGGSGCNTAAALCLLGAPVSLVGHLGQDPFGQFAREQLVEIGVDTRLVEPVAGGSTGYMLIAITSGGQRTMFGFRGCNALPPDQAAVQLALDAASWLHVSGYSFLDDRQWPAVRQVIAAANRHAIPVSLDPSLEAASRARERILEVIPGCQVLLLSCPEALALGGVDDLDRAISALRALGATTMGIKLGERGCRLVSASGQVDLPAFSGKLVKDTTGAGDCFNAGFLYGLLSAWPDEECARLGNALAYLAITSGKGVAGLREPQDLLGAAQALIER